MSFETSVVIPTLDDAATLPATVERLNRVIASTSAAAEVLIVDAGSQDGTLSTAAELADRYPLLHMRVLVRERARSGFGSLVRLGVAYAQGRFCVLVMPDARDPLELIPKMLTRAPGRGAPRPVPALRGGGSPPTSRGGSSSTRRSTGGRSSCCWGWTFPDSTYGFRAFNRTFVQALGLTAGACPCARRSHSRCCWPGEIGQVPGGPTGPDAARAVEIPSWATSSAGTCSPSLRARLHRLGVGWF